MTEFPAPSEMPTEPSPNGPADVAAPAAPRVRRRLSDPARKAIITVLILGALAGIGLTGMAAVTGTGNTSDALPDSVDRLIPESGAEVLRQSQVGIDVAEGYDAYLQINGTTIKTAEDGLIKDLGTGLVQYQPAPGLPIEKLNPDQNCVIAFVWDQLQGETTAEPVSWCFQAT